MLVEPSTVGNFAYRSGYLPPPPLPTPPGICWGMLSAGISTLCCLGWQWNLLDRSCAARCTRCGAQNSLLRVAVLQDDDTNFHMDMIAGLANMRARNYSIQEVRRGVRGDCRLGAKAAREGCMLLVCLVQQDLWRTRMGYLMLLGCRCWLERGLSHCCIAMLHWPQCMAAASVKAGC